MTSVIVGFGFSSGLDEADADELTAGGTTSMRRNSMMTWNEKMRKMTRFIMMSRYGVRFSSAESPPLSSSDSA